jgi:hypothetical protein
MRCRCGHAGGDCSGLGEAPAEDRSDRRQPRSNRGRLDVRPMSLVPQIPYGQGLCRRTLLSRHCSFALATRVESSARSVITRSSFTATSRLASVSTPNAAAADSHWPHLTRSDPVIRMRHAGVTRRRGQDYARKTDAAPNRSDLTSAEAGVRDLGHPSERRGPRASVPRSTGVAARLDPSRGSSRPDRSLASQPGVCLAGPSVEKSPRSRRDGADGIPMVHRRSSGLLVWIGKLTMPGWHVRISRTRGSIVPHMSDHRDLDAAGTQVSSPRRSRVTAACLRKGVAVSLNATSRARMTPDHEGSGFVVASASPQPGAPRRDYPQRLHPRHHLRHLGGLRAVRPAASSCFCHRRPARGWRRLTSSLSLRPNRRPVHDRRRRLPNHGRAPET